MYLNKFPRFLLFPESLCTLYKIYRGIYLRNCETLRNQGTVELKIPGNIVSMMFPGFMKGRELREPRIRRMKEGTAKPKIYNTVYFTQGTFFSFCANVIYSTVCEKSLAATNGESLTQKRNKRSVPR